MARGDRQRATAIRRRTLLGGAAAGAMTAFGGRTRSVAAADALGPLSCFLLPTPQRAYDSRPGSAPNGTDPDTGAGDTRWANGEVRRIDISFPLGTGTPTGVPTSSQAVLLSVTVVWTAGSAGGNLRIWGDTSTEPVTSSIAWDRPGTITTATVTTAHVDGRVRVRLNGSPGCATDVVIDVLGYFDVP